MKLFSKSKQIPGVRKPDYDFIKEAEKEFRLDDNGFDERMDEAILEEFWKTFPRNEDETIEEIEILIELLYKVCRELNSIKHKDEILDRIEHYERCSFRLSKREWDQRHYALRDNMIDRGKRRRD